MESRVEDFSGLGFRAWKADTVVALCLEVSVKDSKRIEGRPDLSPKEPEGLVPSDMPEMTLILTVAHNLNHSNPDFHLIIHLLFHVILHYWGNIPIKAIGDFAAVTCEAVR